MFFGQFNHSIDEKNRLMIPRRMREEAGVKVFILKGFDGCISIYKASTFESIVEKISTLSFNLKDSRDYIRNQLASAFEIDVDKQGCHRMSARNASRKRTKKTSLMRIDSKMCR